MWMDPAVDVLLRLVLPSACMVAVIGVLLRRTLVLLGVLMFGRPEQVLALVKQMVAEHIEEARRDRRRWGRDGG